MFPAGYNNAYQIITIPGYVVMVFEMIHETRMTARSTAGRASASRSGSGTASRADAGKATRSSSRRPTTTTKAPSRPARPPAASADPADRGDARRRALHAGSTPIQSTTRSPSTIRRSTPSRGPSRCRSIGTTATRCSSPGCHEGNYAMANALSFGRKRDKEAAAASSK